jgi:dienelactone hydrolase
MRYRKLAPAAFLSAAALLTAACGGGGEGKSAQTFSSEVQFDPTNATNPVIPFPFDGLFSGSATPTLNVPGLPAPLSDINQLDGFSTSASIFADVTGQLDYSTVPANIIIFNTSTKTVLVPGTDFTVENENATSVDAATTLNSPISYQRSRLLISPLKPLTPGTQYLVGLTNGMKTTQGAGVIASPAFQITSSATPVSQQTNPAVSQYTAAQQAELEALRSGLIYPTVSALSSITQIPANQFVLAWSFTTESIGNTLQLVAQNAKAGVIEVANTGVTTSNPSIGGLGYATIYAGITTVPYYLQAANIALSNSTTPTPNYSTAPLSGYWHADPTKPSSGNFAPTANTASPVPCAAYAAGVTTPAGLTLQPSASTTACFPYLSQSSTYVTTQTIPVMVTVPNSTSGQTEPAAGWPVVIFQHGITANREDVLGIADALARAGFVAVAIDLPLHGLTSTSNPFYQNQLFAGTPAAALQTTERTFNLALENPPALDSSGSHFINLASLITSRDNVREAVADLLTLGKTVQTLSLNGTKVDVNPAHIYYMGHSLGGIVGGVLLGVDAGPASAAAAPEFSAAVLANPGGGIGKLLNASISFGPVISAGLAQAGVVNGTDTFETFLRFAQTLIDDGDPINYATTVTANHAVDLIEVEGDLVVPNSAPSTCPSPLPGGITSPQALLAACPATATEAAVVQSGYLSGTDPLIAAQGLSIIGPISPPISTPNVQTGAKLNYVVKFAQGTHSTVLSPAGPSGATQYLAVTEEMQSEIAQFLASDGQCLAVGGTCP